jgi:hypothetical protein
MTFVNLMSSGEFVAAYSEPGRGYSTSIEGRVDTFAGGRQRAISIEGERVTYPFTLVRVTPTDLDTLISWKGQTVCVRDNRGRRFFGAYFEVAPVETRDTDHYNVPLTVVGVTLPEEDE